MRAVQRSGARTALHRRRAGDHPLASERGREVLVPRRGKHRALPGKVRGERPGRRRVAGPDPAAEAAEQVRRAGQGARRRIPSRLLSRGGWSLVVATTGVNGLNFLFHVLISRLLGPSHYGALGAVLNVISVLAVPLGAVQLAVTQAVVSGAGRERMSLRRLTVNAMLWGAGAMAGGLGALTADRRFPEPEVPLHGPGHWRLGPARGGRRCPAGCAARRAALRARRHRLVHRRRCAAAGQRCPARPGGLRAGGRRGGDGDRPGVHYRGPPPGREEGSIRHGT